MKFLDYLQRKFPNDLIPCHDGQNYRLTCINSECEDFYKNSKKKLYINVVTGAYNCFRCGFSGRSFKSFVIAYEGELNKDFFEENSNFILDNFSKLVLDIIFGERKVEEDLKMPIELVPAYTNKLALNYLQNRGVSLKQIKSKKIMYCPNGDLKHRLVFPVYSRDNKLVFYQDRHIFKESLGKSRNSKVPKGKALYNFDHYNNLKDHIVLVEGPLDCLTIDNNCVALLGKKLLKEQFLEIRKLSNLKKVFVMLDGDALRYAVDICKLFASFDYKTFLVRLKGNEDPNNLGKVECLRRLKSACEFSEFGELVNVLG